MTKPKKQNKRATIRTMSDIGSNAAENDSEYLSDCFIDAGYISELLNTNSNKSIVLGRVGSGKTALLSQIIINQNCKIIDPSELSLNYITNSDVLSFIDKLGLSLNNLFQALWKHVLVIELIKAKYKIEDQNSSNSIYIRLFGKFLQEQGKKEALEYFNEFGGADFWKTTEVRIREIIQGLEDQISSKLGVELGAFQAFVDAYQRKTDSEKKVIESNVKKILDTVQITKLHKVIDILSSSEEFRNESKFYLVIDDLDQNWAEENVRYQMIRSLIETIKRFRKIRNTKIIIALRTDLLDTVIRETRDSGFQEEKFEDYFLKINWSDPELKEVVHRRIQKLYRMKYIKSDVMFSDIFTEKMGGKNTLDYMLERTLGRPRDIIMFVNKCFEGAVGKNVITKKIIDDAEREYSRSRLVSLCEEWADRFPNLSTYIEFLKGMPNHFCIENIGLAEINDFLLDCAGCTQSDEVLVGVIRQIEDGELESSSDGFEVMRTLMSCLFITGSIGCKFDSESPTEWVKTELTSYFHQSFVPSSKIYIHPMLFRTLAIRVLDQRQEKRRAQRRSTK